MASEVIFVQFNAAGCPGADGSLAMPYCAPGDAVNVLTSIRHVIVIIGNTNGQMSLSTTGISPVVIGRKNGAGTGGSIPAGAATAISVSSDTVLVRDLTVSAGTTGSMGIHVSNTGTKVSLLRVTAMLVLAI